MLLMVLLFNTWLLFSKDMYKQNQETISPKPERSNIISERSNKHNLISHNNLRLLSSPKDSSPIQPTTL